MTSIYFVACVSKKQQDGWQGPARDLYQSPWFCKAREYVEARGGPWYILSAWYGLLEPTKVVTPYDYTLKTADAHTRELWGRHVFDAMCRTFQLTAGYVDPTKLPGSEQFRFQLTEAIFLAGDRYREQLMPRLQRLGIKCTVPMEGLGIGKQLQWLTENK